MRRLSSPGLPRRLGVPALAVLALGLGACSHPTPAVPDGPAAPSSTPSSSPAPTTPPTAPTTTPTTTPTLVPPSGGAGSDGLTVRYLDNNGTVKTVRVEDFPR